MSSHDNEYDFYEDDDYEIQTQKVKTKTRKRKWREIENIKEQRRLKRELADYEVCSF